ncbi:hypothetical protein [Staphylococcus capitis]|uniref:hypothetical protein n=1 Tax=Staphylococcus capitis TaxID=29388 RepID=UPI003D052CAE
MHRWRPLLTVTIAALLLFGATACSLTADDTEQRDVADTLKAFPADVATALRLGNVKKVYGGEVAQHVDAQRTVGLVVPVPPETTAGAWTAGCQVVVAALASTSARLYGWIPNDSRKQWVEGTDELCRRGLGLETDEEGERALRIGVRRDATSMVDTGASYDPNRQLVIISAEHGRTQGKTVPVTATTLAEVDRRVRPTKLPWRYEIDAPNTDQTVPASLEHTIVVPAGTPLRLTAACTGLPNVSLKLDTDLTLNRVHLSGGLTKLADECRHSVSY